MALIDELKNLLNSEVKSVRNIVALLFTLSLESFINDEKVFECPEKGYTSYGWMFIFVPAVVVTVLSVMLSDDFWRIILKKPGSKCIMFGTLLYNAGIPCLLWLFWAFFEGRYYTCATKGNRKYHSPELARNATEIDKIFHQAKTESQVIAFSILLVAVIIPAFFLSVYRYFAKPEDLDELRSIEVVKELDAFKDKLVELAEKEAKGEAKKFFENPKEGLKDIYKILRDIRR